MGLKERLKAIRVSLNKTQKQVAEEIGVKESHYQRYERGTSLPNMDYLIALADCFGTTLDYLVGKEKAPQAMGLTERETELIKYFRSLNNDGQVAVLRTAKNEYQVQGQNGLHSRIVSSLKRQDYEEESKALQK